MADELALISGIKQSLIEARTFTELKQVRDQAEAMRQYAVKQKTVAGWQEASQECAEFKLRAERELGFLLSVMVRHEGGRPKKQSHDATVLPEGISKSQSSRWQQVASIPDDDFESYISAAKERETPITTAGCLRTGYVPPEPTPKSENKFKMLNELAAIDAWLTKRRASWPVSKQGGFIESVRLILEQIEFDNTTEAHDVG